jgi:hypothetical protein
VWQTANPFAIFKGAVLGPLSIHKFSQTTPQQIQVPEVIEANSNQTILQLSN